MAKEKLSDSMDWFRFYWKRFLIGTADFTDTEVGAYLRLLVKQYDKGGIDESNSRFKSKKIREKFDKKADGKLYNETMEDVKAEQAQFIGKQSNNGSKGGRPRNPNKTHGLSVGNPELSNGLTQSEAKKSPLHIHNNTLHNSKDVFINIGFIRFFQKPSDWLKENKTSAIENLMMSELRGVDMNLIYEKLDGEKSFYAFSDENHVYNSFKDIGKKLKNGTYKNGSQVNVSKTTEFTLPVKKESI